MCWQLRDCILRDNRLSALTYITLMKTQILKHFQHFFTNQSFFLFQRKQLGLISQPVNRAANGSRDGSIKVSSILFEILLCKIVLPLFFRLPHTQYWGLAYQEFRGMQERDSWWEMTYLGAGINGIHLLVHLMPLCDWLKIRRGLKLLILYQRLLNPDATKHPFRQAKDSSISRRTRNPREFTEAKLDQKQCYLFCGFLYS